MRVQLRNVSLDKIYEKYDTRTLAALTDDEIKEIARELSMATVPNIQITDNGAQYIPSKLKTAKAIESAHTYNFFMPSEFRSAEQNKLLSSKDTANALADAKSGNETFRIMADFDMGVADFSPGSTGELEVTKYAYEEWLLKIPAIAQGKVIITAIDGKPVEIKSTSSGRSAELLEKNSKELQEIAADLGMKSVTIKTKKELVEYIMANEEN